MRLTPEQLLAKLDELGIETETHEHAPVFTVAESKRLRGDLAGGHCKSLFLKDKKGALWLVVTLEDRAIDIKALRRAIGSAPLSFARPELLEDVLGITPGAVTPFALVNDTGVQVRVVLDAAMMGETLLNYHPLTNAATTSISPAGLLAFIRACGHEPAVLAL
ncbi:MAG: prolyl-tRNA synthetase associated domain-containing protein [Rhodospirillales bacterium]|jgi:Ala-tRNA(Pro) deacylase|nr:prolyl-tRNA synthetase associated domain-containing protein [Rhodospirillales bacterium]MDP6804817.1 prolyl-tRNA synthetase associated domain-containing protein [Rhodospirillales bacterium]